MYFMKNVNYMGQDVGRKVMLQKCKFAVKLLRHCGHGHFVVFQLMVTWLYTYMYIVVCTTYHSDDDYISIFKNEIDGEWPTFQHVGLYQPCLSCLQFVIYSSLQFVIRTLPSNICVLIHVQCVGRTLIH